MSFFNKPLFKLFLVFLITYTLFARIDGWPENSRLDLTRAIVDEGTFKIDSYANNTGDRAYYNGHYYTDKFPGTSFLAVLPYFVFKHVFGTPSINNNFYVTNPEILYNGMIFFVMFFTTALFSSLTVILVYKTAGFFTKKKSHKYIVAISYGLGTIAFNYATLFYDHAISTFFSFLAFYIIYSSLEKRNFLPWRFIIAGLSIGFAVITTPFTLVVLIGLFFYLLFKKKYLQVLYFFIASLVIVSVLFLYNFSIFNSFDFAYNHVDKEVFSLKPLFIENSACIKDVSDRSYLTNLFLKLFVNVHRTSVCDINFSILYSDKKNDSFVVVETNSFNETFTFVEVNNEVHYFTRTYLVNKELKPYFFKFLKNNSNFLVFFKKQVSDEWIKIYDLEFFDSNYKLINYERGKIYESNCPFDKKLLNDYLSCDETISTFSGVVIKKYEKEYSLLNKTEINGIISKEFKFSRKKIYENNNLLVKMIKLLFYPYRGLLIYSPVLLLSFIGLFFMFRKHSLETLLIIFIFLSLLFFQSSLFLWVGGTAFGPRHLLPIIPFLFIPFVFALKRINLNIVFLIVALSILINFFGMQELELKGVPINGQFFIENQVWDSTFSWKIMGNPLLNHYFPLFFKYGPRSMLLEKIVNKELFPFSNVFFLLLISFIIFSKKNVFDFNSKS